VTELGVDPDERKLVEAARRGDADAFQQLVRKHQRKAYAVALGMVHDPDEARDVCQDAFLKAHKNLAGFEGDAQFFTWLYRIIANLCIDHLRKRRGERMEFDETIATADAADDSGIAPRRLGFDPGRALADKELRHHIHAALDQLTPSHRAVLVMREVEGLSYKEMADVMKCSIGTIMSRLFHARKKMQALLLEFRAAEPAAS
jgi:RNA polymerase sigma-70 factor (ECF subfamily)